MKIWNDVGFYAVIFLAALQGIPSEIIDAANVDGANEWQTLWRVKIPMLNPVVVFAIVMGTLMGTEHLYRTVPHDRRRSLGQQPDHVALPVSRRIYLEQDRLRCRGRRSRGCGCSG